MGYEKYLTTYNSHLISNAMIFFESRSLRTIIALIIFIPALEIVFYVLEIPLTMLIKSIIALVVVIFTMIWYRTKIIMPMAQCIEQLSSADDAVDFSVRIELNNINKDYLPLFLIINDRLSKTEKIIHDLHASIARLTPMSTELAETYGSMNQNTIMQAHHGKVLSSSINDMLTATENIEHDIQHINTHICEMSTDVKDFSTHLDETVLSIGTIEKHIEESNSMLSDLRDDSNKINKIIEEITGIAEQTNLLALNAAIEAARAGEQGRGFAVVADEVRSLAERTSGSADQVKGIVDSIYSGTHNVSAVMESSQNDIKITTSSALASQKELTKTETAIEEIRKLGHKITLSMQQQSETEATSKHSVDALTTLNIEAFQHTNVKSITDDDLNKLLNSILAKLNKLHVGNLEHSVKRRNKVRKDTKTMTVNDSAI
jgi:methyl-accepting chemotaxis protein